VPYYVFLAISPALIGVAVVLAVIRADPKDLPAIVRAVMRIGSGDSKQDDGHLDDGGENPPSLPGP
jgi:hypothetical protein